jgi:2-dehydropantoate 2-reductase
VANVRNSQPTGANITVLGAGSLGSVYAAWAAQAGNTVTVVARSAHVDAINAGGLTLVNRDGSSQNISLRATTDPRDIEECDFLCLACKAPDTEPLLDAFLSRQRSVKASFSIQNGVRQAEPLQRRFGSSALACVSMVGGTLTSPGTVTHTFEGATYLGPVSHQDSQQALAAAAELATHFGGNGFVGRPDIMSVLWSKAILAAAAMAMSSITRMNYHRIFELAGNREAFLDLVKEAASIAKAEAIPLVDLPGPLQAGYLVGLPQDEALTLLTDLSKSLVSSGQTQVRVSMLQSIDRRRPTEVTAVFSDLLSIAARHNLYLPRLAFVTKVLESIDQDIRET